MFIPWQLGSDNEVPILFFANKMDMPAAATPMEVWLRNMKLWHLSLDCVFLYFHICTFHWKAIWFPVLLISPPYVGIEPLVDGLSFSPRLGKCQ